MFDTLRQVIESGGYELTDVLHRIEVLYASGSLSDDEMTRLQQLARDRADPEDSYAPLAQRVTALEEWRSTVERRLAALEATHDDGVADGGGDGEGSGVVVDEWPGFVQPTGAHDAYQVGDHITWNGMHYECTYAGCVWDPDTYPAGWRLVEPATDAGGDGE